MARKLRFEGEIEQSSSDDPLLLFDEKHLFQSSKLPDLCVSERPAHDESLQRDIVTGVRFRVPVPGRQGSQSAPATPYVSIDEDLVSFSNTILNAMHSTTMAETGPRPGLLDLEDAAVNNLSNIWRRQTRRMTITHLHNTRLHEQPLSQTAERDTKSMTAFIEIREGVSAATEDAAFRFVPEESSLVSVCGEQIGEVQLGTDKSERQQQHPLSSISSDGETESIESFGDVEQDRYRRIRFPPPRLQRKLVNIYHSGSLLFVTSGKIGRIVSEQGHFCWVAPNELRFAVGSVDDEEESEEGMQDQGSEAYKDEGDIDWTNCRPEYADDRSVIATKDPGQSQCGNSLTPALQRLKEHLAAKGKFTRTYGNKENVHNTMKREAVNYAAGPRHRLQGGRSAKWAAVKRREKPSAKTVDRLGPEASTTLDEGNSFGRK